ncbi:glycerophosphodiester phosphodiesterase, putative [Plasmodium berghei]|uniref:Glycerophosphodiester phosphodiesterase, putative n=2 Tax=Plasmodium berghei TaxID=5821 RepID=A0A509AK79_PLABA|nr:glycerophosphodiester phosphodiesterase, putative [Plasmodium berghei ANKA]CXI56329.1 glycerophosphodiester phosphodiesterase, putative [Plasmodium berghei]SCL95343.1 glycerophosphodiester phosphodiesterase, putative [Plasmodium berghei]SCM16234.1 glycerophosphodiester phosphodiesterase, putative [Plasmodium berghei]SCM18030.1 glycerophosphodiester phosphodiesterase, putative [Plasmodium berghei]SCN26459.1 glycerophosphodiester phosphodiesterase, putative [Plasmodium berghei]|eukprot:XP_034422158.1 glycerophosphodiester phosphodiesterase, putative [Plasmodium berghei ANKA]
MNTYNILVIFAVLYVQIQYDMGRVKTAIIGHRGSGTSTTGGTSIYPENSLYSFKYARDSGIQGIELDAWLTKDNKVIIIHGTDDNGIYNTLSCTDGNENKHIEDMTAEEIQSYHFKEPWLIENENLFDSKSENNIKDRIRFFNLGESIKTQKRKEYLESRRVYLNMQENEQIEHLFKEHILKKNINMKDDENSLASIFQDTKSTHYNSEKINDNMTEEEFIENIACIHCKNLYIHYIQKTNYDLKTKILFFKFLSKFYYAPLLIDVLNLYKKDLSYDIELKGTNEKLGEYVLDILENYKDYKIKISSFNWLLQGNEPEFNNTYNDFRDYPKYNRNKIDQIKAVSNNRLNIPIALLFSDDEPLPNVSDIMQTLNYYNAEWAHFSFKLRKQPLFINCDNSKVDIITEEFIKLLHKNGKKVMIYWGTEDQDEYSDMLYYINMKVDSICPNRIDIAKTALQNS